MFRADLQPFRKYRRQLQKVPGKSMGRKRSARKKIFVRNRRPGPLLPDVEASFVPWKTHQGSVKCFLTSTSRNAAAAASGEISRWNMVPSSNPTGNFDRPAVIQGHTSRTNIV